MVFNIEVNLCICYFLCWGCDWKFHIKFCRRSSAEEGRVKKVRAVVVMEREEGAQEVDGERDMEVTQMMKGRGETGLTTSLAPVDGRERMTMKKLQDPMLTCMN